MSKRISLMMVLFAVLIAGCGSGEYRVIEISGKVLTCKGEPAEGGTILFSPIPDPEAESSKQANPGRESRGAVAADGTFTVSTVATLSTPSEPGAIIGTHRVTFQMPPTATPRLTPGEKADMSAAEIKKLEAEFASRPVFKPIPCGITLTPNVVTVSDEQTTFEFTLSPK